MAELKAVIYARYSSSSQREESIQQPPRTTQPGRSDADGEAQQLSDGSIIKPQKMAGQYVLAFPEVPTAPQCRASEKVASGNQTGYRKSQNLYFISLST